MPPRAGKTATLRQAAKSANFGRSGYAGLRAISDYYQSDAADAIWYGLWGPSVLDRRRQAPMWDNFGYPPRSTYQDLRSAALSTPGVMAVEVLSLEHGAVTVAITETDATDEKQEYAIRREVEEVIRGAVAAGVAFEVVLKTPVSILRGVVQDLIRDMRYSWITTARLDAHRVTLQERLRHLDEAVVKVCNDGNAVLIEVCYKDVNGLGRGLSQRLGY